MCVDTYQGSLHLTHPLDLPAEHLASLLFHCLPQLVLQPLSLSVTKIPTALSCAWMCSFSNFCFKPSEPLLAFKQLVLMACPVILQNSCTDEAGAGLLAKFCSRRLSIDCRCFCHRFSSFPLNKLFFFFFDFGWFPESWNGCDNFVKLYRCFLEKGFGKLLSLCWSHLVSIVFAEIGYTKSYVLWISIF